MRRDGNGFTLIRTRLRRNLVNVYGFTLIELLIVIAIIGVLATFLITVGRSSQVRGRDTQRKSDLNNIVKSLELFYSDYNIYPAEVSGKVSACPYNSAADSGSSCSWGSSGFTDDKGTIYFRTIPADPDVDRNYIYLASPSRDAFRLYASLENPQDPEIVSGITDSCGPGTTCNFAITSGNTTPTGSW